MSTDGSFDAAVVGSGPNGLCAALELARAGRKVVVFEAHRTPGGGARTEEISLPGFRHDLCSSIHPLAVASPVLRSFGLEREGLRFRHPELPLAHPFPDGPAAVLDRSAGATARGLGIDHGRWRRLVGGFAARFDEVVREVLAPPHLPRSPRVLVAFGVFGIQSAAGLARRAFRGEAARGLLAGLCAHGMVPLEWAGSAAIGLVLAAAGHAVGWPAPEGGAGALTAALLRRLRALGGEVFTDRRIRDLAELPARGPLLFDVPPAELLRVARDAVPPRIRRSLSRFRHGPGVFKVDWALAAPIPWRDERCRRAGTVHVGGRLGEIAAAERAPFAGRVAAAPFLLVTQPSLFDPHRAPPGRHTAWATCHVPPGWRGDLTGAIEARIEAFAPGFRDCILARVSRGPADLERENPSLVGGDIGGGVNDLRQLLFRPRAALDPYRIPGTRLFLCSASTPPGAGVHGLCGGFAARSALRAFPD